MLRSNNIAPGARDLLQTKSARELRQGGSDYRCCIPALAGFVSPQSIAPDGEKNSLQDRPRSNAHCHSERTERESRNLAAMRKGNATGSLDFARDGLHRLTAPPVLTVSPPSDSIVRVKWISLILLSAETNSCTTLVTRRDLYSPEPGSDSYEARRQWASATTTTPTQMRANPTERDEGLPLPAPQFR